MSYYALFSLFPLLLVLVSAAGMIIRRENAYEPVLNFFYDMIPISQSIIERNMDVILNRSATIGIIGLVGSLWSASGFFNTLVRNINRAWAGIKPANMIRTRVLAISMIGIIFVLLVLSIGSTVVVSIME
jgi:membrane protein